MPIVQFYRHKSGHFLCFLLLKGFDVGEVLFCGSVKHSKGRDLGASVNVDKDKYEGMFNSDACTYSIIDFNYNLIL